MCVFMLSEKMIFKENWTSMISSLFFALYWFSEIGETFACKGYFVRGKEYQQRGLIVHNIVRSVHDAPAMELTDEMNWIADKCARHYAKKGKIDHNCPYKKKFGECLWMSGRTKNVNPVDSANSAVKAFYSEVKNYNFDNTTKNTGVTGHFTQVVWDTSTELGIGWAQGEKGNVIVSLYNVHGNIQGTYKKHVFPPKRPLPKIKEIGLLNGVGKIIRWDIMIIILCMLAILHCQYYI